MRLLIAHDGSPQSDALVADLSRCGLPESGRAVVLSVADAWTAAEGDVSPGFASAVAGVGGEIIRAAIAQAKAISERGRDAVAKQLPGWTVDAESVAGSPAWEIIRKADEWRPDMVMVGATGTSRLERIVFGTTTNQIASHARCSVHVARPRASAKGPVKLLLGCDGSQQSLDAALWVAGRRWPAGSEARVMTAVDGWLVAALESTEEPRGGETEADARGRAKELPGVVAPILEKAGLKTDVVVRDGDPKHLLVEEADAWNADCIVVGARGRHGLQRLLLGSVAIAAASRAHCSVEIVRKDETTRV